MTALSARWIGARPLELAKVFACLLLHFVGDYYGSGPGWPLYLLAPFSWRQTLNPQAWPFNGWQSQVIFVLLCVATVAIARWNGRTPIEAISARIDLMYADLAALGFSTKCDCGRRALYRCHVCRSQVLCQGHIHFLDDKRVACKGCAGA